MPADVQLEELLEAIREKGPEKVVHQYRHNLLPSRMLIELYSKHPEQDVLLFLALYPTVPSQVLEDLTEACTDPAIQAAAATNPRCSHLMLVRMAHTGGAAVRRALAANRFHSPKVTADLLRDPDLHVRVALAQNSAIKGTSQALLAHDEAPAVRTALAGTSKISEEIIHTLSADASAVVRASVYAKSKATPELLINWARTDSAEIQRLLLLRKKLPPAAQRVLSASADPVVQEAIDTVFAPAPATLLARAESEQEPARIRTAQRDDLPEEIQHVLANDPLLDVRVALAANPAITVEIALWIATSSDLAACLSLAENPALPAEAALELCHHEHKEVRLQMAYRDDLTEEQLDILVNQHKNIELIGHLALRGISYTGTGTERAEQLIEQRTPSHRVFAARSVHLTTEQKRTLASDPAVNVRLALCDNPSLSRNELTALTRDWNDDVASQAKDNLNQWTPAQDIPAPEQESKEESSGLVSQLVRFFKD